MSNTFILVMDSNSDPDTWNAVAEKPTRKELEDLNCYEDEKPSIFYDKAAHPKISEKNVEKAWCDANNIKNPGTIYEIQI